MKRGHGGPHHSAWRLAPSPRAPRGPATTRPTRLGQRSSSMVEGPWGLFLNFSRSSLGLLNLIGISCQSCSRNVGCCTRTTPCNGVSEFPVLSYGPTQPQEQCPGRVLPSLALVTPPCNICTMNEWGVNLPYVKVGLEGTSIVLVVLLVI